LLQIEFQSESESESESNGICTSKQQDETRREGNETEKGNNDNDNNNNIAMVMPFVGSALKFDQPVYRWDTSKVTDTSDMFRNAHCFQSAYGIMGHIQGEGYVWRFGGTGMIVFLVT